MYEEVLQYHKESHGDLNKQLLFLWWMWKKFRHKILPQKRYNIYSALWGNILWQNFFHIHNKKRSCLFSLHGTFYDIVKLLQATVAVKNIYCLWLILCLFKYPESTNSFSQKPSWTFICLQKEGRNHQKQRESPSPRIFIKWIV